MEHCSSFVIKAKDPLGGSIQQLQKLEHTDNSANLGSLEIIVSSTGSTVLTELPAITSYFYLSVKIQVFLTPGSPRGLFLIQNKILLPQLETGAPALPTPLRQC